MPVLGNELVRKLYMMKRLSSRGMLCDLPERACVIVLLLLCNFGFCSYWNLCLWVYLIFFNYACMSLQWKYLTLYYSVAFMLVYSFLILNWVSLVSASDIFFQTDLKNTGAENCIEEKDAMTSTTVALLETLNRNLSPILICFSPVFVSFESSIKGLNKKLLASTKFFEYGLRLYDCLIDLITI